jgi:hypothetical protein
MNSIRHYINIVKESELVEPVVKNQQVNKLVPDKLKQYQQKVKDSDTDDKSGFYAYSKELNPHEIKLTSFMPTTADKDAKLSYIEAVAPLQGANPFVPTTYEIKIVKADNLGQNLQKPAYVMQKLITYEQVPSLLLFKTCYNIIKSIFVPKMGPYDQNLYKKLERLVQTNDSISNELMTTNKKDLVDPITKRLDNWEMNIANFKDECVTLVLYFIEKLFDGSAKTTDKNLQVVMQIIKKLIKKYNFDYDLHSGNIMFRPTSNQYQLVITDPIV